VQPFENLLRALHAREVRFVLIGVEGANYWAPSGSSSFLTHDRDLFLPLDPDNLLRAWQGCLDSGFELTCAREPLDSPRDEWLAQQVVRTRALTSARHPDDHLPIDLTLVMAGFHFDQIWSERREFLVSGQSLPVARLRHIVESKRLVGRPKDELFLETLAQSLQDLFETRLDLPPRPEKDDEECR
jgi:hypothetical protein